MGLFNFKKQNKQKSPEPKHNPVQPTPVISQKPLPDQEIQIETKEEKPKFISQPRKKKDDISSLFKINIYDIFKYDPKLISNITIQGKSAEKYSYKLPDLELGTFYRVDIIKYNDGAYELIFVSNINEVRKELKEFIDFCVNKYGKDFMNKGEIVKEDYRDLPLGVFSRVWHNRLRLENLNYTISLTLYNLAHSC